MKRIVIVAFAIALGGCGEAPEICHAFGNQCPKGGTIQNCCTPDYVMCDVITSDGTDFVCEGSDCSSAYMLASDWCQTH